MMAWGPYNSKAILQEQDSFSIISLKKYFTECKTEQQADWIEIY